MMNSFKKRIISALMAVTVGVTGLSVTSFAEEKLLADSVTVEYKATVAKPSYKIKGENGKRKIKLTCGTSGATIYYTTDGSTPTTASKKYGGGLINLKSTKTIKAIAVKNGESSSVMSKKIKVNTVLGDATGNGSVSESDYTRLEKYLNEKTSYVCKDNCDIDGNGKINNTDLQMLRDYLDGKIDEFDDSHIETNTNIKKPEIVVYRAFGGKRIQLTCDTAKASVYYTLDGSTPDKYDKKYTGKFVISEDTVVKAVAYLDGKYSTVKTRELTVDPLDAPYADKSTGTQYEESVKVALAHGNSNANILYTTNGTDPLKYGYLYKEPIELTSDTTLKIAAECKGYSNSKVVTYEYKVKSSRYTISGRVWDDTSLTTADGVYQYGEKGIDGITVSLLNTATNTYDASVKTSIINGVSGCYVFDKVKPGVNYKVVFQYNGQKYRAYPIVVSNGNQAVPAELPKITIKNSGAYTDAGALLANINSYATAIVSAFYAKTYATTTNVYTSAASDVNLALRSDIYGDMKLEFTDTKITNPATNATSSATNGRKIFIGDIVTYKLRMANNSTAYALNSSEVLFYIDDNLSIESITLSDGTTATYSYQKEDKGLGLKTYLITCPKLDKESYVEFEIKGKVNADIKDGSSIVSYAEVVSYTYEDSCYDKTAIPGNFTGTVKENDETASIKLIAYSSVTSAQALSWLSSNDFATPIPVNTSRMFKFKLDNGSSISDFNVYIGDNNVISCTPACNQTATGIECILFVTGKAAGKTNIVVMLSKDSSKYIDANITVG